MSRESFIFSLTNRHKFKMCHELNHAIFNNSKDGPCFGNDLSIDDNADSIYSDALNGYYYSHDEYKK